MSVLRVFTYNITSIAASPIGCATMLMIMSVSTFKIAVILHSISLRSVLLVEETRMSGENHQSAAVHKKLKLVKLPNCITFELHVYK
jgi:hypothetical protein